MPKLLKLVTLLVALYFALGSATCSRIKVPVKKYKSKEIALPACGAKHCTPTQGVVREIVIDAIPGEAKEIRVNMYLRQDNGCGGVKAAPWEQVGGMKEPSFGWSRADHPKIGVVGDGTLRVDCVFRNWRECVQRHAMLEVVYTVMEYPTDDRSIDIRYPSDWNDALKKGKPAKTGK